MSIESRGSRGKGAWRPAEARPRPGDAGTPALASGFLARARGLFEAHPRLVTWAVLAVGMVAILLWAARDVDLLSHQRLVLVLATVALAGLCAWIIGWEQ